MPKISLNNNRPSKITFREELAEDILQGKADEQTDNTGQIIIYTQRWEWLDGTIRDEPDPSWIISRR